MNRSQRHSRMSGDLSLLADHPPLFAVGRADKLGAHLDHLPLSSHQWRPDVPLELSQVFGVLLAKWLQCRPAEPQQVVDALQVWARGADVAALARRGVGEERSAEQDGPRSTGVALAASTNEASLASASHWARRHRHGLIIGVLLALVGLGLCILWLFLTTK